MGWTVLEVLNWTTAHFQKHHIRTPRLDAEVLLSDTLQLNRVQLYTSFDKPLTANELATFRERVRRRADREPVAYITGHKAFWSTEFAVGAGVLIPRPDTETLVEHAISLLARRPREARGTPRRTLPWSPETEAAEDSQVARQESAGHGDSDASESEEAIASAHETSPTSEPAATLARGDTEAPALVLDLCTGVGNIAICLALETGCRAIGVDISPKAVQYARANVATHGLEREVAILLGDLTAPVPRRFEGRFNLLTANPPYLTPSMLSETTPEIVRYEPREALLGGADGLEVCRRILDQAERWLAPGGSMLVEIGTADQAGRLIEMMSEKGFEGGQILSDLAGNARVVVASRPLSASEKR